jgi:hypothetical protein
MKLLDILTEISINTDNFYPYNLSKNRNQYSATFTTEKGYEYEYKSDIIDGKILDVAFKVNNIPNAQQTIEKTEKSIDNIWIRLVIDDDNYTKELFDLETNKGVLNVDYIDWWELSNDKEKIEFINYIKSKFSAFNGKSIDLNQLSSYNILIYNGFNLDNRSINGFKIISGNQELIINLSKIYKNYIEMYYKLNLNELDENLITYMQTAIKDFALSKHIGYTVNTNEGNMFKVMTTVFRITKEIFDSNDKLEYLSFTPVVNSKEKIGNDLDQSKRSKLYTLYINQFYPNSYRLTGDELDKLPDDVNEGTVYRIIK